MVPIATLVEKSFDEGIWHLARQYHNVSEHDELDLSQFVGALFAEFPEARMKVTDLMHMTKLDNKNRFEFLAIAGHQKATGINQTYFEDKGSHRPRVHSLGE